MHHIYTTQSLILKREPLDTSAYFLLLTRDLGLIRARAQGVRKDTSRLRGTLQEFSLATVAYVQTKAGWKITTAIPERNFWQDGGNNPQTSKILAHVSDTLIRLIAGEEKNLAIFDVIVAGFSKLVASDSSDSIEALMLVRLLRILGYADSEHLEDLFKHPADFGDEVLARAGVHKADMIKAINKGFRESQM